MSDPISKKNERLRRLKEKRERIANEPKEIRWAECYECHQNRDKSTCEWSREQGWRCQICITLENERQNLIRHQREIERRAKLEEARLNCIKIMKEDLILDDDGNQVEPSGILIDRYFTEAGPEYRSRDGYIRYKHEVSGRIYMISVHGGPLKINGMK